jgi:hypothetical protein
MEVLLMYFFSFHLVLVDEKIVDLVHDNYVIDGVLVV